MQEFVQIVFISVVVLLPAAVFALLVRFARTRWVVLANAVLLALLVLLMRNAAGGSISGLGEAIAARFILMPVLIGVGFGHWIGYSWRKYWRAGKA